MIKISEDRFIVLLLDGTMIGPIGATSSLRNIGRRSGFQLLGGRHSLFAGKVIEPMQWFAEGKHISGDGRVGASLLDINKIAKVEAPCQQWPNGVVWSFLRISETIFSEQVQEILNNNQEPPKWPRK